MPEKGVFSLAELARAIREGRPPGCCNDETASATPHEDFRQERRLVEATTPGSVDLKNLITSKFQWQLRPMVGCIPDRSLQKLHIRAPIHERHSAGPDDQITRAL